MDNVEPGRDPGKGFGGMPPGSDEISDVIATFNRAPDGYSADFYNHDDSFALFAGVCSGSLTVDCYLVDPRFGGAGVPGKDHVTLRYAQDDGSDAGLNSVDVEFNLGTFTPCSAPYGPGAGGASDAARAADACTPPSHTRIKQANINGNTPFFRFTARHTTRFECVLLRNKRVMFRHSCHSPKRYTNPLPHGHYRFIVTGVNQGGLDPKPATKKFTVK